MPGRDASPLDRLRAWVPRWWRGEGGAAGWMLDRALWPAEQLFRGLVLARNTGYDLGLLEVTAPPIPVVSIGNLGVGGAGKTPVAAWVAARLAALGRRPAIVLRGYGADEVLVHRELNPAIPVYLAPRRAEGVRRAVDAGADVAVLDDGLQHRALGRQLDLALVAAESWRAPLRLLPRGPWREGPAALRRAHLVVVTRKSAPREAAEEVATALGLRVPRERIVQCRIAPTVLAPLRAGAASAAPLDALRGRRVLAVASLADPRPFAAHLREAGAEVELAAFPDHHPFSPRDVDRLVERGAGRLLVMTRKDAVKLRPLLPDDADAWLLDQQVRFEPDAERIDDALRRAIRR